MLYVGIYIMLLYTIYIIAANYYSVSISIYSMLIIFFSFLLFHYLPPSESLPSLPPTS